MQDTSLLDESRDVAEEDAFGSLLGTPETAETSEATETTPETAGKTEGTEEGTGAGEDSTDGVIESGGPSANDAPVIASGVQRIQQLHQNNRENNSKTMRDLATTQALLLAEQETTR
jgi:hypothetical protein